MFIKREEELSQTQIICIEDLVPPTHLLRKIENAIDWSFIYELVEDKYCKDNGRPSIDPVFPYSRPKTKEGFFKKYEYVYDEFYDCYICPNDKILNYSTTNRDGYREYKSCPQDCAVCPYLSQCTESKNHTKIVTRHIWENYMEQCEDIRQTIGNKELYGKRNHRTTFRNSERKPWFQIYTDDRQG